MPPAEEAGSPNPCTGQGSPRAHISSTLPSNFTSLGLERDPVLPQHLPTSLLAGGKFWRTLAHLAKRKSETFCLPRAQGRHSDGLRASPLLEAPILLTG